MPKLTKSYIDKVVLPAKGETFHWDGELKGFGLRVTPKSKDYPNGKFSFIAQGRLGRGKGAQHLKSVRVTIGTYGKLTPDEARKAASKTLGDMQLGINPNASREAQRTVRQIADDYLRDIQLKPRSKEAINKIVAGPFTKFGWIDKPLASITRDEVAERFLELRERTPAYANHIFGTLRALFNHAITKNPEAFKDNPVKVLRRMWAEERVRIGRIDDHKLGAVWMHLEELRVRANKRHTRASIDFVSFLLLTGCRRSEAAELTWDRVNLDEGWWHIADTKNSNPVWLPLPTQAVELLRKRPTRDGLVFGIKDPRDTMASISKVAGLHLSPHDLRRTFTNVGIQLCRIEIVKMEQLTNHVPKSVLGRNYTERQKLQYLKPEVQLIADRIAG